LELEEKIAAVFYDARLRSAAILSNKAMNHTGTGMLAADAVVCCDYDFKMNDEESRHHLQGNLLGERAMTEAVGWVGSADICICEEVKTEGKGG
jgi:hypothetical protein